MCDFINASILLEHIGTSIERTISLTKSPNLPNMFIGTYIINNAGIAINTVNQAAIP